MALVAKANNVSPVTKTPPDTNKFPSCLVGEDIAAGDACYFKSDGKIWRSTAAGANAAAEVHGFAPEAALVGQRGVLSLFRGVSFNYGSGLTPGSYLYLSATNPGQLDTVLSANQPKPVGLVYWDGARVRLTSTF